MKETRVIPELKNPTRYVRIDKNYVGGLKDMEQYKQEFIEFMVESDVLKFGEFHTEKWKKISVFYECGSLCDRHAA